MDKNLYQQLWAEKYRPTKISDVIVDKHIQDIFNLYVSEGDFPNLILYSKNSGTGKTTLAKAMVHELDLEPLIINGSLDGTIDTLRNEFSTFVKTLSMSLKKKVIIIDEADKLSTSMQDGLRNFFEEYSDHVRFIMTCNHVEKIENALQSRCIMHEISSSNSDTLKKAAHRVVDILKQEGREFVTVDVVEFVKSKYPDMRKILNTLQKDSVNINDTRNEFDIENVTAMVLAGDFTSYNKWVNENIYSKQDAKKYYDMMKNYLIISGAGDKRCAIMFIKIHEALFKLNFIDDPQINVTAFMSDIQINGYMK